MNKKGFKSKILHSSMKYSLIRNNFVSGRKGEIEWIKILKNKYPSIIDNNTIDKFSSMDAISNENGILIEHELKSRNIHHNKHDGLMFNECKMKKSIKQLEKGIRQIYYWNCTDGLYYWEFTDMKKQKDEMIFSRNGNHQTGEGDRDIVDIKTEFLKLYS
tara:strand:- start:76 stop:555 length:480 start_codon:yes stop_codon:yes gene_type:complete